MGRRRRRQQDEDFDDSLERAFANKRSKPEHHPSPETSNDSSENKAKSSSSNNKDSKDENKNKDNKKDIERLQEKKRLKKLRQKEKKLAAHKEQEKRKAYVEKQKKQRDIQKQERKKFKELEKKKTTNNNTFVKTAMGVRYMDIVGGTGPLLLDRKKIVCQYVLRAKDQKGKLLDSGDRFSFKFGKGEVIKGWEIGLKGMRQGGKRHIIVPPQAGYGNKDIGGGKGALLYFDVTLLQC